MIVGGKVTNTPTMAMIASAETIGSEGRWDHNGGRLGGVVRSECG